MNRYVKLIGKKAKKVIENKIDTKTKNKVLKSFLIFLTKNEKKILKQNQKDIKFAKKKKLKLNIIDRLTLNSNKLDSIKKSVNDIIKIKDPVNEVLENWKRPNGLNIKKVSTPIGVIGVIYEADQMLPPIYLAYVLNQEMQLF